jgi:hypothetical protein
MAERASDTSFKLIFGLIGAALAGLALWRYWNVLEKDQYLLTFLLLALVSVALPWLKSVKLGSLLEMERVVETAESKTREKVEDVRREVQTLTANLNTMTQQNRLTQYFGVTPNEQNLRQIENIVEEKVQPDRAASTVTEDEAKQLRRGFVKAAGTALGEPFWIFGNRTGQFLKRMGPNPVPGDRLRTLCAEAGIPDDLVGRMVSIELIEQMPRKPAGSDPSGMAEGAPAPLSDYRRTRLGEMYAEDRPQIPVADVLKAILPVASSVVGLALPLWNVVANPATGSGDVRPTEGLGAKT